MNDTGFCERSVRGALTKLVKKRLIRRHRRSNWSRNSFAVMPADEDKFYAKMKAGNHNNNRQDVAEIPAADCILDMQPTAPKKIKENIKKKETDHTHCPNPTFPEPNPKKKRQGNDLTIGQEEFERRARTAFERKGLGYEALINLPSGEVENTYRIYANGEINFSQAMQLLFGAHNKLVQKG